MISKLNEHSSLSDCESIIDAAFRAFVYAGQALKLIKDNKLWEQAGRNSFAEYCNIKWNFGFDYAGRLIAGYEIVELLISAKAISKKEAPYIKEAEIRPARTLLQNTPELIPKAYKDARKNNNGYLPTSIQLKKSVDKVNPKPIKQDKGKVVKFIKVSTTITMEQYEEWSKNFENLNESEYLKRLILEDIKKKRKKH
jgi:hypothetical protein